MDEWTGFQLDYALAYRFSLEDQDFVRLQTYQIMTGFAGLAKAMGAKGAKVEKFKPQIPDEIEFKKRDPNYIPTVEEAILAFGGKGVVMKR